jgi:hypothetical protein
MDERWSAQMADRDEGEGMSPAPLVRCSGCGFSWNSDTMAEGLKLLGSCPKCDGTLEFRETVAPRENRFAPVLRPALAGGSTAPHLVLGIPRR